jgi:hypothetical protein
MRLLIVMTMIHRHRTVKTDSLLSPLCETAAIAGAVFFPFP